MFYSHKSESTLTNFPWGLDVKEEAEENPTNDDFLKRKNKHITDGNDLKEAFHKSLSNKATFDNRSFRITIPDKNLVVHAQAMFTWKTIGIKIGINLKALLPESYDEYESLETYNRMAFLCHTDLNQAIASEQSIFRSHVEPREMVMLVMHLPEGFCYNRVISFLYRINDEKDQLLNTKK